MKYGRFSKDQMEYIINRPDTPRPWVNYLFNDIYHAIISQTGGGFSYTRDPKFNRIHRYDRMLEDRPGRYLFFYDTQTKQSWSANWQPMMLPFQCFETRHGLGYTTITSQYFDIQVQLTFFVPQDASCEICSVEITNWSQKLRQLKVFPFINFVAGDALSDIDYPNIFALYNRADFYPGNNAIIAYKQPNPARPVESYAFFASTAKVESYDCVKEQFLGRYGTLQQPLAVLQGACGNSVANGEDMVGVFAHPIELKPGGIQSFVLITGFVDDKQLPPIQALEVKHQDFLPSLPTPAGLDKIGSIIEKFNSEEKAKKALSRVKEYWRQQTSEFVIKTPDENMNRMTNIWGKYQLCGVTRWRGTSAYHNAEGGTGYRDTAQDIEGILALDLSLAKRKLDALLKNQYANGNAVSGFSDVEGSWEKQGQDNVVGKSDVAVWLVFAVIAYLEETGDFAFLDKVYPFLDGGEATVYEHCKRVLSYLTTTVGEHGLPLIFKADWNDAYDRLGYRGKGETIWLAMATIRALRQMIPLAELRGEKEYARQLVKVANGMQEKVLQHGWDGKWFITAINDIGYRIGSAVNKNGKLTLNSQTWAVLAGIVEQTRGVELLQIVDKELDTPYGPVLFSPVYTDYHPGIGRVTAFAPGTKENAAVFSHAAAFKVVADCMIKRGNAAYETFCKIMPTNPQKDNIERYKAEPYVYAEYVVGPGHPVNSGEGAFTWNTGTAPWMFLAATEWICGVRRTFVGLFIDPCIPSHWNELFVRRPFRGAVYNIAIKNPDRVESGVVEIIVDGKKINGQLIPPDEDGMEHEVVVLMG